MSWNPFNSFSYFLPPQHRSFIRWPTVPLADVILMEGAVDEHKFFCFTENNSINNAKVNYLLSTITLVIVVIFLSSFSSFVLHWKFSLQPMFALVNSIVHSPPQRIAFTSSIILLFLHMISSAIWTWNLWKMLRKVQITFKPCNCSFIGLYFLCFAPRRCWRQLEGWLLQQGM